MTPQAGSGPLSRVRRILRRGVSLAYDAVYRFTTWIRERVVSLRSPAAREGLLIAIAYVTGVTGIVTSVVGDPPGTRLGAIGIGLMGISFLCLFVVSVSILRATGGEVGDR